MPALPRRGAGGKIGLVEESASYGVAYDRYEPSFYTGFAPRALDPARVHLHLGRGNQLRVTEVLSDEVISSYARDLRYRALTYRKLVDTGRIVLTQNRSFEKFEAQLTAADVDGVVAAASGEAPEVEREKNLELMEKLNPGRIFRIRMVLPTLVKQWRGRLRESDVKKMSERRRLELLGALLPTRIWAATIDKGTSDELGALVRLAQGSQGEPSVALQNAYVALVDRVAPGLYPRRGNALEFTEFTAVYPVGSFNGFTTHRGRKIPMYPTPGRRALTTHQRTKTVDHIPDKVVYGYFPWIPYMHVGDRLHNSFHTLWWKMEPKKTSFLSDDWHDLDQNRREDGTYRYLWLLSRGPMSHGCTHVNAGHISELRQTMPSPTEELYEIDTFLNKSHLFDVFDIDGDMEPEVIGVHYFIAFSLRNKKPHELRAPNERKAFYDWLYGGELRYREGESPHFSDVRDGRFAGRTAIDGELYSDIKLYEAPYEPERIQFYRLVDIPFARELRKVGVHHPLSEGGA